MRTGTFFCVTTATLSTPRTPTDVNPADRIALKAYSARLNYIATQTPSGVILVAPGTGAGAGVSRAQAHACVRWAPGGPEPRTGRKRQARDRTNLEEPAFRREHRDVAIISRGPTAGHDGWAPTPSVEPPPLTPQS